MWRGVCLGGLLAGVVAAAAPGPVLAAPARPCPPAKARVTLDGRSTCTDVAELLRGRPATADGLVGALFARTWVTGGWASRSAAYGWAPRGVTGWESEVLRAARAAASARRRADRAWGGTRSGDLVLPPAALAAFPDPPAITQSGTWAALTATDGLRTPVFRAPGVSAEAVLGTADGREYRTQIRDDALRGRACPDAGGHLRAAGVLSGRRSVVSGPQHPTGDPLTTTSSSIALLYRFAYAVTARADAGGPIDRYDVTLDSFDGAATARGLSPADAGIPQAADVRLAPRSADRRGLLVDALRLAQVRGRAYLASVRRHLAAPGACR